jgi:hypothetical protein
VYKKSALFALVLSSILVITSVLTSHNAMAQSTSEFLAYTDTNKGFTVEYPSDWTVSEENPDTVYINAPANAYFGIQVRPSEPPTMTLGELANKTVNDLTNTSPQYGGDFKLVEMNTNNFFLGGHPAVKLVIVGTPPNGTETRLVAIDTIVDRMQYSTLSFSTPSLYHEFDPLFQRMIESFRIIRSQ